MIYKIFCPIVARALLKMQYRIIDLQPNFENREKSVFIFLKEGKIVEDSKRIEESLKNN